MRLATLLSWERAECLSRIKVKWTTKASTMGGSPWSVSGYDDPSRCPMDGIRTHRVDNKNG